MATVRLKVNNGAPESNSQMAEKQKNSVDELKKIIEENSTASETAPLVERAFLFLEDGKWEQADAYCERVLDKEPKNSKAYLGKLMAELKINSVEKLNDVEIPFGENDNCIKAGRFNPEIAEILKKINDSVCEKNEEKKRIEEEKKRAEEEKKSEEKNEAEAIKEELIFAKNTAVSVSGKYLVISLSVICGIIALFAMISGIGHICEIKNIMRFDNFMRALRICVFMIFPGFLLGYFVPYRLFGKYRNIFDEIIKKIPVSVYIAGGVLNIFIAAFFFVSFLITPINKVSNFYYALVFAVFAYLFFAKAVRMFKKESK